MVFRAEGGRSLHSSVGSVNIEFRNLFQANDLGGEKIMNAQILLLVAVLVFSLMITGLFLTMREFQKAEDPSVRKGESASR